MDTFDALLLGTLQGLAEYLPISSSGHLEIFKEILGVNLEADASLQLDVILHVATVLSTIVILWREFVPLCTSFFTFKRDANTEYVLKILLSCVPIAIVGVFFKDSVEKLFGGNLLVVGICLCVTAALLAFAYFTRTASRHAHRKRHAHGITWLDAFIIGIAQAVAVLPGLSRSGTTIATGIMLGANREKVAQFSFFMVIIPILGEALLDIKDIIAPHAGEAATSTAIGSMPLLLGFLSAFIVGCAACKLMLNMVKKGQLVWFSLYCLAVGVLCIIF